MKYPIPSYNATLDVGALFPQIDVTTGFDLLVNPGQRVVMPDWLDQGYQNLLNNVLYWTTDTFTGQKWGTLCYKHQGTTGLWFFNLAFNGLQDPAQCQPGMQLRFPSIAQVQQLLVAKNSTNRMGRTVTL